MVSESGFVTTRLDVMGVARNAQTQYIQLHLVVTKEPRLSNKSARRLVGKKRINCSVEKSVHFKVSIKLKLLGQLTIL